MFTVKHTRLQALSLWAAGGELETHSQECLLQVKSGAFYSFVCRLLRRCGMQTSQKQREEKGRMMRKKKNTCLLIKGGELTEKNRRKKENGKSCRKWEDRQGEAKHGTEDNTAFESGSVH